MKLRHTEEETTTPAPERTPEPDAAPLRGREAVERFVRAIHKADQTPALLGEVRELAQAAAEAFADQEAELERVDRVLTGLMITVMQLMRGTDPEASWALHKGARVRYDAKDEGAGELLFTKAIEGGAPDRAALERFAAEVQIARRKHELAAGVRKGGGFPPGAGR